MSENRRGILLPDYPDLAREAVGARFAVSLCRSYGANQKSEYSEYISAVVIGGPPHLSEE